MELQNLFFEIVNSVSKLDPGVRFIYKNEEKENSVKKLPWFMLLKEFEKLFLLCDQTSMRVILTSKYLDHPEVRDIFETAVLAKEMSVKALKRALKDRPRPGKISFI